MGAKWESSRGMRKGQRVGGGFSCTFPAVSPICALCGDLLQAKVLLAPADFLFWLIVNLSYPVLSVFFCWSCLCLAQVGSDRNFTFGLVVGE